MKQPEYKIYIQKNEKRPVIDLLQEASGLSKSKIKDAMNKGAVWQVTGKKRQRLRRVKKLVPPGTTVDFYYNETLLGKTAPEGKAIHTEKNYSVWFKPAGLMTQGTFYGDHCSVLRQAELSIPGKNQLFPVNRLDRETPGILIIAHNKQAAAKLSELFKNRKVKKYYQAVIKGNPGGEGETGRITLPLDEKDAITEYKILGYDEKKDEATAEVRIITGRYHQIRRHFDMIGHPVVGDPTYGTGNKNRSGLKLYAKSIEFKCPFSREMRYFEIPEKF